MVEAYDLFKSIYLERGYRQRDIAQLILEKNLFGLDIDQRAAQLTGFALMMKGREDDRRLFERGVKLNVMAMVDSTSLDVDTLVHGIELSQHDLSAEDLAALKDLFEHATTFGSLIQVPQTLTEKLPALKQLSESNSQDMFVKEVLEVLAPLIKQAEILAAQYDAVVANPPYMGGKGMNGFVKKFSKEYYPSSKSDLFSCFIERGYSLASGRGYNAMVTMQSWMFLSSFEKMRKYMINDKTIATMAHLGARAFGSISGEVVQTTAFVLRNLQLSNYKPVFNRLLNGDELEKRKALIGGEQRFESVSQDEFKKIPGSPIGYWLSRGVIDTFIGIKISDIGKTRVGCQTSDNNRFLRLWHEISKGKTCASASTRDESTASKGKWFPYNKGGSYRKWFGNVEYVVNWEKDGEEIFDYARDLYGSPTRTVKNGAYYFRPSVTWSKISSGAPSFRYQPAGAVFDVAGASVFFESIKIRNILLSQLNSVLCVKQLAAISPTLNYETSHIAALPIVAEGRISSNTISAICEKAIELSSTDWNAYERSWDFQSLPILTAFSSSTTTLESSYTTWIAQNRGTIDEMQKLEEENNRLFIDAYGLQDELSPEVPIEQITLTVNPAYLYGIKGTEEERNTRFREDTMAELVSYAIGCMMGRYSLDELGLIYANSGNEGFDASRYTKFPADDDGIVPITDKEWFDDDAANRLVEFISVAWDKSHIEENLDFLAANLSPKKGEGPRDTLRRYLSDSFFQDHTQTYKKRPIYWLFSSGKQKAFQCLVYLHRYNEGTLARMRTEYVIPLTAKMSAYEQKLKTDADASSSAAEVKRLEKEIAQLHKQQAELSEFDEKLRHYADQRISLDLDDGVKVNYGKFGNLLANVKEITGNKAGE